MIEGWYGDSYVALFSDAEGLSASERYEIRSLLPGFSIIGLLSWDDFIVQNQCGEVFTVPTVPCDLEHLTPYQIPASAALVPDARFWAKSSGTRNRSSSAVIQITTKT